MLFLRVFSNTMIDRAPGGICYEGAGMEQGMNRHIMHACIIIVLVAVTFCRSLGNDFVWDDIPVVVENQLFNGSAGIMDVLTAEDTLKEGVGRSTGYYRPLSYLSFYIDRSLWGMNPA